MENPPLWVWAIVVGLIITGKYAYRWKTTRQLAKEMNDERKKVIDSSKTNADVAIKNNSNTESNSSSVRTAISHNIAVIDIVLVPIEIILKQGRESLKHFRSMTFLKEYEDILNYYT